jgi:hypothetical protein
MRWCCGRLYLHLVSPQPPPAADLQPATSSMLVFPTYAPL